MKGKRGATFARLFFSGNCLDVLSADRDERRVFVFLLHEDRDIGWLVFSAGIGLIRSDVLISS